MGGGFNGGSVWMKAAFVLVTIGFVVWLSAGSVSTSYSTSIDNTYYAFLIIGVCAYFLAVMLTFLYVFIDEVAGNKVALIIGVVTALLAGCSAIIALAIGQSVSHSDRLAYSAICAIVCGVFCILELTGGGAK